MASIMDTLLKNSSTPFARELSNSFLTENAELNWATDVPFMNLALSGTMEKGIYSGITVFAGPSKHFKSMYALKCLDAWLSSKNETDDFAVLFYDTEYGITDDYIAQFPNVKKFKHKIIHVPVTTVEELKHESAKQIEALYEEYKETYKKSGSKAKRPEVFILLDSIGQVASNKETVDSIDGKLTVDMTRAKAVKSFFRIITSKVKMMGIPMVVIAHTYSSMEMFSKEVVSSGTGTIYSADSIFIIGKSQSKVKEEIAGYNFTLKAEKSRFVKEKSKFPITVHYDKGILTYSGFLDIAKGLGYVSTCRVGVKGGWKFVLEDCKQFGLEPNEGESFVFKTLTNDVDSDKEFWETVMKYTDLKDQITALYKIPSSCSDDELALVDAMPDELKELIAND